MTEEEAAEAAECVWGEGGEESRARAAVREELARLCGSGRVGCGVVVCCGVLWCGVLRFIVVCGFILTLKF